ncbi:MAG: hypothetical protein GAK29_02044 [Acinetobacter bereziniae]|uniref:Uncharacterized protein n=1 Tax=Acinetobacter bereziniae TaxID=106648 RepID=A0A833PFP3_ACIBZ|nr:MAG: hypothetical protein GAK29_02044 [Acinetobacter bereziniae]
MNVTFFFNWTQEDEGCEIIHFPSVVMSKVSSDGSCQYFPEAASFIQSLNTTEAVWRVLKIVNFFIGEKMLSIVEIKTLYNTKAIIQRDSIKFQILDSAEYKDDISLNDLSIILNKWIEYLLTIDKQEVIFDIV